MERDKSSAPVAPAKDEASSQTEVQKESSVNRRSFSFLAATVPAVFALSCKTTNNNSGLQDAADGKDGGDTKFSKNTNFTTAAFGEEGGKDINATTRTLGEEGGATTRALGEEGGKGGFVTTQAVNEEGGPGLGDEKWGPVVTTQALNEESSGDNDDLGKLPTVTTRKLKEEGGADSKHVVTSLALGEEGGKNGGGKNGGGFNLDEDKGGKQLVTTQAVAEEGGKKNNIVTTQAVAEEGGNNSKKDVILTSAALGEEGTGNKDDLYLSTRALHEEGSDKNDIDRVKDIRATSLAIGEEGGKGGNKDGNKGGGKNDGFNLADGSESPAGGLPSQQVAMIIIQSICNELGINIVKVDIETRLTRTQKELLWITYTFESLNNNETVDHKVTIKWLEDWTEDQFGMFAEKQIRNKLGLN